MAHEVKQGGMLRTQVGYCKGCKAEVFIDGESYEYKDGKHSALCPKCQQVYNFKIRHGLIVPSKPKYSPKSIWQRLKRGKL